jgi:transposase
LVVCIEIEARMVRFVISTDKNSREISAIEDAYHKHRASIEGAFDGVYASIRTSGDVAWNDNRIQQETLAKAFDILGPAVWNYGFKSGHRMDTVDTILKAVYTQYGYRIKYRTFRRWLIHYLQYGESPSFTKRSRKKKAQRGRRGSLSMTSSFSRGDDQELMSIIEGQPQLYLDEIAVMMEGRTGKKWAHNTIWRRLHDLGYSLQVAVQRARQAQVAEQHSFYWRLSNFVSDARQIILIDETHRSKNAARRRRAWSLRGQTPVVYSEFEENFRKRYTMIGAANINAFIPSACEIVEREEEGGTVNAERFSQYMAECIVPILGNYARGEPNSVVILDNATIHLHDEVRNLIEGAGAVLILTAPYSPHLNPIEYFFSVYKARLARNSLDGALNWWQGDYDALKSVTPEFARNTFIHCNFPGIEEIEEVQDSEVEELAIIMIVAVGFAAVLFGR